MPEVLPAPGDEVDGGRHLHADWKKPRGRNTRFSSHVYCTVVACVLYGCGGPRHGWWGSVGGVHAIYERDLCRGWCGTSASRQEIAMKNLCFFLQCVSRFGVWCLDGCAWGLWPFLLYGSCELFKVFKKARFLRKIVFGMYRSPGRWTSLLEVIQCALLAGCFILLLLKSLLNRDVSGWTSDDQAEVRCVVRMNGAGLEARR